MKTEWKSDAELFRLMRRELYTAVVGDIMDVLGFQHQFLPQAIQPLRDDMIVAGRAMPVLEADVFEERKPKAPAGHVIEQAFGLLFEAIDQLKRHEVYVCTGAAPRYALWGELCSVRAIKCGAVGAVCDGMVRDTRQVLGLGFPTFSRGRYAQDQGPRGKVIDYRCRIEMDGVTVRPGDIVFGDIDGVCVVPREIETDVITKSLGKVRGEKLVKKALEQGMTAQAAFKKYGIM